MYNNYLRYLNSILDQNIKNLDFKCNKDYIQILEHVNYDLGVEYIEFIENEFGNIISFENISDFININDKYGSPLTFLFHFLFYNKNIRCSPSNLRYIYHALVILHHFKKTNLKSIVEIGCGYGGLCLAIVFFANILNIEINEYHLCDFPEVCHLTNRYLKINNINIKFIFHDCHQYGQTIHNNELYLISNYCFTAISDEHRQNYVKYLFDKIKHGFIVWQTFFGVDIQHASAIIKKPILSIIEEKPQTCNDKVKKNYFVSF